MLFFHVYVWKEPTFQYVDLSFLSCVNIDHKKGPLIDDMGFPSHLFVQWWKVFFFPGPGHYTFFIEQIEMISFQDSDPLQLP